MNEKTYRIVGWALPIIVMIVGSWATYSQFARLKTAEAEQTTATADLARAQAELELAQKKVVDAGRYAAAPSSATEEPAFLDDLRRRAERAGVSISSWSTTTSPAAQPTTTETADASREDLLAGISREQCVIEVDCTYQAGRAFIEDLTSSPRLYTINNASWKRGAETGTKLTITASRYVLADSTPKT